MARQDSYHTRDRFEKLLSPVLPSLYGMALRLTRDPDEAEDLVQQACLRGYRFFHTFALNNATIPYVLKLADMGFEKAVSQDPALARGVNTYKGHVTHPAVAQAVKMPYKPLEELL